MTATILSGDVFQQLPTIKPGSVDCVVASPPYFGLRSYLPKSHPLKRFEIGNEKTPAEYLDKMVRAFQLVRDAMADHATCWLNIGDSYVHDNRGGETGGKHVSWHGNGQMSQGRMQKTEVAFEDGNLLLIPQRLAMALQDDGWIVRSYVIWHKPAPMPSSVSGWRWMRHQIKIKNGDRVEGEKKGRSTNGKPHGARAANGKDFASTAHYGAPQSKLVGHSGYDRPAGAQWEDCPGCKKCIPNGGYVLRKGSWRPTSSYEPILMLAKTADYFCDGESVKTSVGRLAQNTGEQNGSARLLYAGTKTNGPMKAVGDPESGANLRDAWKTPLAEMSKEDLIGFIQSLDDGQLPDVWRIVAEPLADAHYAAFPTELVRKCLQAGTSAKGYCASCGKPWVRVIDTKAIPHPSPRAAGKRPNIDHKGGNQANGSASLAPEVKTVGWRPSCKCPKNEPRPALVCDPFAGSGRTALAARWLGLDFIGCELNPLYVEMSERILREDSPLFS